MANRFLGEVDVTVEDRNWRLRFDFNAMCEFEDRTGKDAMKAFEDVEKGKIGIRDLRMVAYVCMLHHQPDATLQEAGDLLSRDMDAVMRVLRAAAPEAADISDAERRGAEGNAAPGPGA
ncbi:hypothetical protein [Alloyangia pacifica]|uniref:hypothetical protein n=1 Tax=Alloyangia pacifica TaxID=311180 RepID=UPI001CFD4A3F|nr:hypothetical protein [Alloyangia pacifica]